MYLHKKLILPSQPGLGKLISFRQGQPESTPPPICLREANFHSPRSICPHHNINDPPPSILEERYGRIEGRGYRG